MRKGVEPQDMIDAIAVQLNELVEKGQSMLEDAVEGKKPNNPPYEALMGSTEEENSWMLHLHVLFMGHLHGIDAASYAEIAEDRGSIEMMLPPDQESDLDHIPAPLLKAHDDLYLNVETVLTCLKESAFYAEKPAHTPKEKAFRNNLIEAWLLCAEAIPNVLDEGYEEAHKRFSSAVNNWLTVMNYPGDPKKVLLTLRNKHSPEYWLDQHGKTPVISMHWNDASGSSEGRKETCVPIRDVIIHNQEKKETRFRFARYITMPRSQGREDLKYYFMAPRLEFSYTEKKAALDIESQIKYYQQFCDQAGIESSKKVYLFDLRSDEFFRGKSFGSKEEPSLRLLKAAAKQKEFQERFRHIAIPLVEFTAGYGFPIEPRCVNEPWSYPLWKIVREDLWPILSDDNKKIAQQILVVWKKCCELGVSSSSEFESGQDVSEAAFSEGYKWFAKRMYEADSFFERNLAATALFSLDYHFHNLQFDPSKERSLEVIRQQIANEQVERPQSVDAAKRDSARVKWRSVGFWSAVLGCLATVGGCIGGFMIDTPVIAVIVFLVSLAVFGVTSAVSFWQAAKRSARPEVPVSPSLEPWAQYYAALTAPRLSAGMLMSSFMSVLEDQLDDPALLVFCQSTKDRTSIQQQLHAYHRAADDLLLASRHVAAERETDKVAHITSEVANRKSVSIQARQDRLTALAARDAELTKHEVAAKAFIFRMSLLLKHALIVHAGVQGAMNPRLAELFKYPVPQPRLSPSEDALRDPHKTNYEHRRLTLWGRMFDFYSHQRRQLISKGASKRNKIY